MTGQSGGGEAAAGVPGQADGEDAAGGVARRAAALRLTPVTVSWFAVCFAVIAAAWLTLGSAGADGVAVVAAIAVFVLIRAARFLAGQLADPAVEWALAGCGVLTDLIVYAGLAASASLHPAAASAPGLAGNALRGTFLTWFGGAGAPGVWRLAVAAAIVTVLIPMADVCVRHRPQAAARPWFLGPPGGVRLAVVCAAALVAGLRAALLAVFVLSAAALAVILSDGVRQAADRGQPRGYRGDGRIAVWIGGWVGGRLPPLPPLIVGLLVTGVLTALGLRNLPGILVLTPVEAMLLAAFASWHPHDGRSDWLVPPLLQTAEYVFLAEIGFAGRVPPPLTFALIAAAGLRHLDLAYRARGGLTAGVDRSAFGWEGRMIVAGIAGAVGVQAVIYPLLALYLWWRLARDWLVGWSARHAAVNR